MTDPQSWDDVNAAHRPVQASVRIPMRADLVLELDRLARQLAEEVERDGRENRDPVAPEVARQIQSVEDELSASEVEFTFAGMGRRALAALEAEHPPTDAQLAEADADLLWDGDTYPPALIAATCIAPTGVTLEAATEIWDTWSEGQVSQVWAACLAANKGRADVGPKSQIASAILHGSAQNSTTAPR